MRFRNAGKSSICSIWTLCVVFAAVSGRGDAEPRPVVPKEMNGCRHGYRLQKINTDYALRRSWAIIANCIHPEMPRLAIAMDVKTVEKNAHANFPEDWDPEQPLTDEAAFPTQSPRTPVARKDGTIPATPSYARPVLAPPTVQAGGYVRLWRQDQSAHVDLAGVAIESGRPGEAIQVRITPGGIPLRGIVRGPGSVELQVEGAEGFRKERH